MAPELLVLLGVGPITAAQVLVSWSHPGRFRSEAAFASRRPAVESSTPHDHADLNAR
ncbi:transposase [Streptomyces sp. NPDC050564]|uniref:transposase n=1 Tax=Streptomyces sp. NPDC050564 TaxID=3365631 RepID=UPI003798F569